MNKTLYNAAMDRITMSGQCENSILEAAMSKTSAVHRKRGKIRFIPVLAAAAILVTGTATAAAANGFDWIKGFFIDESFKVTDDIAAMTVEMNNFNCVSEDEDIRISPIGTIADTSSLYCLIHVDSMPSGSDFSSIKLADICVNGVSADSPDKIDINNEYAEGRTFAYSMNFKEDNTLAVKLLTNYKLFKTGDNIKIKLAKVSPEDDQYAKDLCELDTIYLDSDSIESNIDISFDLEMGEFNSLEINYDTGRIFNVDNDKLFAENIYVGPLRILVNGYYCDYVDNYAPMVPVIVTLKDGSQVTAIPDGGGMTLTSKGSMYDNDWCFESPINPDNISAIYISDTCLYDCNAQ